MYTNVERKVPEVCSQGSSLWYARLTKKFFNDEEGKE
jgi:hypothetical protein